jgi:hypothetical protein
MTNVRLIVLAALAPIALAVGLFIHVPQAAATTIYGVSGDYTGTLPSWVFAIDPDAMTLTMINPALPGVGASLAPSPTSTTELFLSMVETPTTNSLYTISIPGGVLSPPIGSPAPVVGLGEGRDGSLYGAGGGPCCFVGTELDLYRISPTTALATLRGAGAAGYAGDFAADAWNLFGTVQTGDLVRVNKLTGVQTLVGNTGLYFAGLAFSLDGRLWGSTLDNKLYEINPLTGASTFRMDLPVPVGTATFDLASEPGVPPPSSLDHFTCYKAGATKGSAKFPGIPIPPGVSLFDQFGGSIVEVKRPQFLCAPTNKMGEDPAAPTHPEHLKGYQIKNSQKPVFPTNITVTDQFNPAGLRVDAKKQSHLLVPTVKDRVTPPPLPGSFIVDHFQCYKVAASKGAQKFVPLLNAEIEDQFGIMHVDVKKPTYLCNPVDKNGEDPTAPTHLNHLMCYQVTQVKTELKFQKVVGVFVNNQFGPEQLDVKKPSELCVPAQKTL